jgi:hypothetical protein
MTTTPRTVGCDILTREVSNKGEDRASLGNFNAVDRVYMFLPASLRVPGPSYSGTAAGEWEAVRDMSPPMHFTCRTLLRGVSCMYYHAKSM